MDRRAVKVSEGELHVFIYPHLPPCHPGWGGWLKVHCWRAAPHRLPKAGIWSARRLNLALPGFNLGHWVTGAVWLAYGWGGGQIRCTCHALICICMYTVVACMLFTVQNPADLRLNTKPPAGVWLSSVGEWNKSNCRRKDRTLCLVPAGGGRGCAGINHVVSFVVLYLDWLLLRWWFAHPEVAGAELLSTC